MSSSTILFGADAAVDSRRLQWRRPRV